MNKTEVNKCTLYVDGMHCAACEVLLEDKISQIDGVKNVKADLSGGTVQVETDKDINIDEVNSLITEHGYKASQEKISKRQDYSTYVKGFLIAALVFLGFLLIQRIDYSNLVANSDINLPFYFILGLLASVSTCMAVVGGIVLSISSNYSRNSKFLPMLSFHVSRLAAFFFLGGLLGVLGGIFFLDSNPLFRTVINVFVLIIMLILGLNLLEIFSFTKKLQFRLPKFFAKKVTTSDYSKRGDLIASSLLGILTFILPCGFTQSVQFQALAAGNFLDAGLILFVFALGTFPVLGGISFLSYKISKTFQSSLFYKTSGFLIILFALYTFSLFLQTV